MIGEGGRSRGLALTRPEAGIVGWGGGGYWGPASQQVLGSVEYMVLERFALVIPTIAYTGILM